MIATASALASRRNTEVAVQKLPIHKLPVLAVLLVLGWAGSAFGEPKFIEARLAEGKEVAEVVFERRGDSPLPPRALRAAIVTQKGKRFKRRFFRDDLVTLVNLYRSQGYRNAEVLRKRIFIKDGGRLRIEIEIDSRARWSIESVEIQGVTSFPVDTLLARVGLNAGSPLDYGRVVKGERALQVFLNARGYPRAVAQSRLVDDTLVLRAAVVYQVDAGPKMYIGDISVANAEQLHTRTAFILRHVTFDRGDLFDPKQIALTRRKLARTGLFRSVSIDLPKPEPGDSLQPVVFHLKEKKHISLGTNVFLSNTEPRVAANIQDNNLMGLGSRLGLDASIGRPVQGATIFFTQRNVLDSEADLVFAAGVTDEWSQTEVLGNPNDQRQFDELSGNDTVLRDLLFFAGEDTANEYIRAVEYDYTEVERVWELSATLTRTWLDMFLTNMSLSWTRAHNQPSSGDKIKYRPPNFTDDGDGDGGDGGDGGDCFFGDEPGCDEASGKAAQDSEIDYFETRRIPADDLWRQILTNRSRALNLKSEVQFDTRNDRISPTRGLFTRLTVLYAFEFKGRLSYVLDGDFEVRRYQPLGGGFTLALAGRGVRAIPLRQGRPLPQVYWKVFGGDSSVRGVERNSITDIGGGRTGLNFRSELRYAAGKFGLALFWDTAGVWRRLKEVKTADMRDGYGLGLRYTIGLPFRLDAGFGRGLSEKRLYLSIGQAF
jgi:outer membrane protein assembly factor BamA